MKGKFRKIDQLEKSFEIKEPDEIEVDFAAWPEDKRDKKINYAYNIQDEPVEDDDQIDVGDIQLDLANENQGFQQFSPQRDRKYTVI